MISKRELIGHMSDEALTRMRAASARYDAVGMNPRAYSAKETEVAALDQIRMVGDIARELSVETWRNWHYETNGGAVWYQEDD